MSGIIYKITCNDTNKCYVGSTVQSLSVRMHHHKSDKYNNCVSRTIIDIGNYKSEIIEFVNFGEDKTQLLRKEREWMEKLNSINTKKPIVSKKERLQQMIDLQSERYKNDPEFKQKKDNAVKEYRKTEVGKQKKQEQDKKYREGEKREELLEKKREWSKQNREKNKEKLGEVIICECGFTYTFHHKARHMKTQRHINNI
jgi:hypothetical protein